MNTKSVQLNVKSSVIKLQIEIFSTAPAKIKNLKTTIKCLQMNRQTDGQMVTCTTVLNTINIKHPRYAQLG